MSWYSLSTAPACCTWVGVTVNPTGAWVTQQAAISPELDERMVSLRFPIRDRDSKFTAVFDEVFRAGGVWIIKTPPWAPRANAIMERWIGSCPREILDRTLGPVSIHPGTGTT
jgi:putative transposase